MADLVRLVVRRDRASIESLPPETPTATTQSRASSSLTSGVSATVLGFPWATRSAVTGKGAAGDVDDVDAGGGE